jgi:hypothetical protein
METAGTTATRTLKIHCTLNVAFALKTVCCSSRLRARWTFATPSLLPYAHSTRPGSYAIPYLDRTVVASIPTEAGPQRLVGSSLPAQQRFECRCYLLMRRYTRNSGKRDQCQLSVRC